MTTAPQDREQTTSEGRLGAFRRRQSWLDWDMVVGVLVAVGVTALATWQPEIRATAPSTLYAILGVSAGLAGIVLATLSIFVAFLTEEYIAVLMKSPGGLKRAWSPYMVVEVVSVTSAVFALITVIVWAAAPGWAQSSGLGVASGLMTWSLIGTAQLVGVTKFHGEMRVSLLQHIQDARRILAQRKSEHLSA